MVFFLDSVAQCECAGSTSADQQRVKAQLAGIREGNRACHAFVHVSEHASGATEAGVTPLLPGVPIAVKDLIDVAGMPTRAGSRAVSRLPAKHAPVIQRLIAQGAVIAGKSHTTEFAMSGWGVGPLGRPLNPIDADDTHYTGGSSNGSASAVACGLVPAALGTDTGGSIRIPASWCGITGLKGSPEWVETAGVIALSQSFDVVGPMARTVADVTRLYRAMLPPERRAALEEALAAAASRPLPALVFLDDASLPGIHPETLAAYRAGQARCAALGHPVTTRSLPFTFAEMAQLWAGISEIEGYLNHRALAHDPAAPLEDGVRANLLRQSQASLDDYVTLTHRARDVRARLACLLTPGHLLVVPTTSTPAARLTEFDPGRTLGIYTRFVNLIRGCAVAVPNGFTADGRPISMQFVGAGGEDAVILHAGAHWQAHTDWHERSRRRHHEQMQRRR